MEDLELTRFHWENAKQDNINIILQNKYASQIAIEAIKLCDKRIAEFPEEVKVETPKKE